jgi:hypothetical protein
MRVSKKDERLYERGDALALRDAVEDKRTFDTGLWKIFYALVRGYRKSLDGTLAKRHLTQDFREWNFKSWYGKMGFVWRRENRESNYYCACCGQSIITLGNGPRITTVMQNKMRDHAIVCIADEMEPV